MAGSRPCLLSGRCIVSHSGVSNFPGGLNTKIQRANIDIWVQALKVAKSSGEETGDFCRMEAGVEPIDSLSPHSLSHGCMSTLCWILNHIQAGILNCIGTLKP